MIRNWNKGTATLILMLPIILLIVILAVLYMAYFQVMYADSIVTTRTDAIADSVAVYGQSYDYEYNQGQVETMTNLLAMYNNISSEHFDYSADVKFMNDGEDAGKVLTVTGTAEISAFYPSMMNTNMLTAKKSVSVKSVDIFGNVLVIPESIGETAPEPSETPEDDTPIIVTE